jgi:aminoglycoside phosphotransferase (APT) family kinase protein
MTGSDLYDQLRAVVTAAGRRLRIPTDDANLLRLHSNAIFVLPSAGLVVRVATNSDALTRVATSIDVTSWLAARGFPCTVPADLAGQPVVEDDHVVSVWRYLPTVAEPHPTGAELGRLLRDLHAQPLPPYPVAPLTNPFDGVAGALEQTPDALSHAHRGWLTNRISELRERWATLTFPHAPGLIHGDAHPNNLMRSADGSAVLGDWDHVAVGPREWDLAQIHYTRRRFGRPPAADIDGFAQAYGWDIREWPELDTLIAVREITGLSPYIRTATTKPFSRRELQHRLDCLLHIDTTARWHPPANE